MIWNLLIIREYSINWHGCSSLIVRIAMRHRRIWTDTILLLIDISHLFKLIARLALTTGKVLQVQLVGVSFPTTHRCTHWWMIILRHFLVLNDNILRNWLSEQFFLLELILILHDHLLRNYLLLSILSNRPSNWSLHHRSMVTGWDHMISLLCSLVIWVVLRCWWLIYLFEPSVKRHWICTIATWRLFRCWLGVKLLWRLSLGPVSQSATTVTMARCFLYSSP